MFPATIALCAAMGCAPSSGGCSADFTADGMVGIDDLLYTIANWGPCTIDDLLRVIQEWGCVVSPDPTIGALAQPVTIVPNPVGPIPILSQTVTVGDGDEIILLVAVRALRQISAPTSIESVTWTPKGADAELFAYIPAASSLSGGNSLRLFALRTPSAGQGVVSVSMDATENQQYASMTCFQVAGASDWLPIDGGANSFQSNPEDDAGRLTLQPQVPHGLAVHFCSNNIGDPQFTPLDGWSQIANYQIAPPLWPNAVFAQSRPFTAAKELEAIAQSVHPTSSFWNSGVVFVGDGVYTPADEAPRMHSPDLQAWRDLLGTGPFKPGGMVRVAVVGDSRSTSGHTGAGLPHDNARGKIFFERFGGSWGTRVMFPIMWNEGSPSYGVPPFEEAVMQFPTGNGGMNWLTGWREGLNVGWDWGPGCVPGQGTDALLKSDSDECTVILNHNCSFPRATQAVYQLGSGPGQQIAVGDPDMSYFPQWDQVMVKVVVGTKPGSGQVVVKAQSCADIFTNSPPNTSLNGVDGETTALPLDSGTFGIFSQEFGPFSWRENPGDKYFRVRLKGTNLVGARLLAVEIYSAQPRGIAATVCGATGTYPSNTIAAYTSMFSEAFNLWPVVFDATLTFQGTHDVAAGLMPLEYKADMQAQIDAIRACDPGHPFILCTDWIATNVSDPYKIERHECFAGVLKDLCDENAADGPMLFVNVLRIIREDIDWPIPQSCMAGLFDYIHLGQCGGDMVEGAVWNEIFSTLDKN